MNLQREALSLTTLPLLQNGTTRKFPELPYKSYPFTLSPQVHQALSPEPHLSAKDAGEKQREKLVAIMVGLPGCGKSYYSTKMKEHFEAEGYTIEIFNVGQYRRKLLGMESSKSEFFDPTATDAVQQREEMARKCFADLAAWLEEKGEIAIFDATNTTVDRRRHLRQECNKRAFKYLFVEVIVDDPEILEKLIDAKVRNGIDFKDKPYDEARQEFLARRKHYEDVYKPVSSKYPVIKIYNQGERMSKNFDRNDQIVNDMFVFLFQEAGNPEIFEENF